jgi:hypothetical protein
MSTDLVAVVTIDRVLGAICHRIDVLGGAANRVAGSNGQGSANQDYGRNFLKHVPLLV